MLRDELKRVEGRVKEREDARTTFYRNQVLWSLAALSRCVCVCCSMSSSRRAKLCTTLSNTIAARFDAEFASLAYQCVRMAQREQEAVRAMQKDLREARREALQAAKDRLKHGEDLYRQQLRAQYEHGVPLDQPPPETSHGHHGGVCWCVP